MMAEEKRLFLEKVQSELNKVEQEIARLEEGTKPISPDNAIGRLTRMDAINNRSISEYSLRQARQKLNAFHYWLSRAQNDDLGRCVHCGDAIPFQRLMFMPQSLTCMHCVR